MHLPQVPTRESLYIGWSGRGCQLRQAHRFVPVQLKKRGTIQKVFDRLDRTSLSNVFWIVSRSDIVPRWHNALFSHVQIQSVNVLTLILARAQCLYKCRHQ
jgi:hypothetical protein